MRALSITILGAFLIACLLTPPVYERILALWPEPPWPFRRVFARVAMLGLVLLAVRNRKALDLALVPRCLAREGRNGGARAVARGLLVSIVCATAVVPLILASPGVARSDMPTLTLLWRSATDLPAALLVGITEECFFRVLVLEGLRRSMRTPTAVVLTTLFYASLHFLRPDKSFVYESSPWSGFTYLGAVLARFSSLDFALPFVGLVVVGLVLGCTIVRTGSLWTCIGLHAGWFLVRKVSIRGLGLASLDGGDTTEPSWAMLAMPWTWLSIAVAGTIVLVLTPRIAPRALPDSGRTKSESEPQEGSEGSRSLGSA
jgi:membrane protease YdiL (CAAX protease family)